MEVFVNKFLDYTGAEFTVQIDENWFLVAQIVQAALHEKTNT